MVVFQVQELQNLFLILNTVSEVAEEDSEVTVGDEVTV